MVSASRWIVPVAGLCAVVAGCGSAGDPDASSEEPAGLAGRSFVVTEMDDPRREVVPGSSIRLEFTADGVAVQAGCNNLGGSYRVEDGRLVVDQLGGTELGCDQPLMAQDVWVTAFLSADPSVSLQGPDLELATEATTLRLSEPSTESSPLEGTQWRIDSLVDGAGPDGTVASVPAGAADGRLLIEGGSLTLTYGCTTITAPVDVADAQLRAGEISATSRDCSPRLGALEQRLAQVLEPPTAYVVTGRNLMLSSDDGTTGLGFVADDD